MSEVTFPSELKGRVEFVSKIVGILLAYNSIYDVLHSVSCPFLLFARDAVAVLDLAMPCVFSL